MGSNQGYSESDSTGDSDSSRNNGNPSTPKAMRWSKFIRNVYEMAICPENSQAVSFSDDGLCVEIRDSKLLSSEILLKYFKHKNVSSFIRQLNNYGFKTIPVLLHSSVVHCFAHDNFRRGRLDLLEGVTRRGTVGDETSKLSDQLDDLKRRDTEWEQRLHHLKRVNEQLVRNNHELAEENKRLKSTWSVMQDALTRCPPVQTSPPPPPPKQDVYGRSMNTNLKNQNGHITNYNSALDQQSIHHHHHQPSQQQQQHHQSVIIDYSAIPPASFELFPLNGLPLFSDDL
jgi:hypothetical protein